MDSLQTRLRLLALLLLASAVYTARSDAVVTGTVFCDQCKDGGVSLFDYPLTGVKVAVACSDGDGGATMWREESTNWAGSYSVKFDGDPDLGGCYAQVTGGDSGSAGCGAVPGPPRRLRLWFRMFGMAMYGVDSLVSQPAEPMSFCPRSPHPAPATPVTPPAPVPTPEVRPPTPPNPPAFRMPRLPPFPPFPPLPRLPPLTPVDFADASACTYEEWAMPEHRCYWNAAAPDTRVGVVFGAVAARRYGTNMTLWEGLRGRGEPYRTLLREATASFLNSCSSLQFPFHALGVVQRLNWAVVGTPRDALLTALQFKRANSGVRSSGAAAVACKMSPCK